MLQNKLFQGTRQQALSQVANIYTDQGFCIVSYVYGAVIVRNKLFGLTEGSPLTMRQQSLFGSDLVLPDGAALLTWWRVAYLLRGKVDDMTPCLTNLNGTDFFVHLLEYYLAQGPINLLCYAVYDEKLGVKKGELLAKAGEWLQQHYNITWTYAQDTQYNNDDMSDWNWDAMSQALDPKLPTLMMVCRGVPRQEIWSYHHRDKLQQYGIVACNQGATIDYWAGRERRAPIIVRKLRLESAWRLISDPRKNWSKFWVSFMMMEEILQLVIRWIQYRIDIWLKFAK